MIKIHPLGTMDICGYLLFFSFFFLHQIYMVHYMFSLEFTLSHILSFKLILHSPLGHFSDDM